MPKNASSSFRSTFLANQRCLFLSSRDFILIILNCRKKLLKNSLLDLLKKCVSIWKLDFTLDLNIAIHCFGYQFFISKVLKTSYFTSLKVKSENNEHDVKSRNLAVHNYENVYYMYYIRIFVRESYTTLHNRRPRKLRGLICQNFYGGLSHVKHVAFLEYGNFSEIFDTSFGGKILQILYIQFYKYSVY